MKLEKSLMQKDFPFSILVAAVLVMLLADTFFTGAETDFISRADGIILLLFFCIFMYSTVSYTISSQQGECEDMEKGSCRYHKCGQFKDRYDG